MRAAAPLLAMILLGCGGSAPTAEPTPRDDRTVRLRVRGEGERLAYDCEHRLRLRDREGVQPMGARSRLELRPYGGDTERWLLHRTYVAGEGDLSRARIEGLQLRALIDAHHVILEGPESTGGSSGSLNAEAATALERILMPYYPSAPVAVGDRWEEPPFTWGSGRFGPTALEVERRFRLVALDDETATIEWDVTLRVGELSVSGIAIHGGGTLRGARTVSLEDGVSGHGTFDVEVDVGPGGVQAMMGRFQIGAKLQDRCTPAAPGAYRGLVQGVRPSGTRSGD